MSKKIKNDYEQATPRRAEVEEYVGAELAKYEDDLHTIRVLEIQDQDDLDNAGAALRDIAQRHDTLDAKRKSWVQPLKAVASDIDKTFKPVLDVLKQAEGLLKAKIGEYHVRLEQERTRALANAAAAAQNGQVRKAEQIIAHAADLDAEKVEGVGVRMEWSGTVVDEELIPREFMKPDLDKLEAVTAAMGEKTNIPGWRAVKVPVVRTARK